jgi:rSAM/selenodomain-associated transferase 2
MLSAVIPTWQAAETLGPTLDALADGPVGEVVVADGGSSDATRAVAMRAGARVIAAPRGRGSQLAAGAAAAAGRWLMFLHADTVPAPGWADAVAAFMADPANLARAAVFRFALDDPSPAARRLERLVAWRTATLGLPYGDQGLLMTRDFYAEVGPFKPIPLMEDVDMVRRIGRRRLAVLEAAAVTSAARYRRDGYVRRSTRNLVCVALYLLGADPRRIERLYR